MAQYQAMQCADVNWPFIAVRVVALLLAVNQLAFEASARTRLACRSRRCFRGCVVRVQCSPVPCPQANAAPAQPRCANAQARPTQTQPEDLKVGALGSTRRLELLYGKDLPDQITAVVPLTDSITAFGTSRGLSLWDGKTFKRYTGPYLDTSLATGEYGHGEIVPGNSALPSNRVQDLLVAEDGKLWIGTGAGLAWYQDGKMVDVTSRLPSTREESERVWQRDGNRGHMIRGPALGQDVMCLFRRSNGQIIIGTRNAGVILYDPTGDTFKLLHHAPEANQWVTAVAEDSKGALWIAVCGLGVLRYAGDRIEQFPFPDAWGPADKVLTLCLGPRDELWIGTTQGLLVPQSNQRYRDLTAGGPLQEEIVEKLWIDRDGGVWARTIGGIAVHRRGQWSYPEFDARQPNFCEVLANGDMWISTRTGVVRDPAITWQHEPQSVRDLAKAKATIESQYPNVEENGFTALDRRQRVWLAYRKQLWRFHGHQWTDLTESINGPAASVSFVKADSKGRVWVGTSGKGLYRFAGDHVKTFFNQARRAISVIYSMAEAKDGTVYIGTQYGLYEFGEIEPKAISENYQVAQMLVDGLGRVWFSDVNGGLLLYDRKEIQRLWRDPKLQGWYIRRISLIRPNTVRVEMVSFLPTGSRNASFECDGDSIELVATE
jgi:sugar lactone lactonase YvrE